MAYYQNGYNRSYNKYQYKRSYTEEEKEKIHKYICNLWNDTQRHLPKVKYEYLSTNIKETLLRCIDFYGTDIIKELFVKVDRTPKLNGTNNKDIHTSIDFVCDLDNASKILNGNYDETDQEEQEEVEQDILSFQVKRVIHREKQKLGRTIEDYLDKELFTDEEKDRLEKANRLDGEYYISDEELQIGDFELEEEKRLESA